MGRWEQTIGGEFGETVGFRLIAQKTWANPTVVKFKLAAGKSCSVSDDLRRQIRMFVVERVNSKSPRRTFLPSRGLKC